MLITLWVLDETSFDRFHEDMDQIHAVYWTGTYGNGTIGSGTSQPVKLKAALEEYPEFEKVTRIKVDPEFQLAVGENRFKPMGIYADKEFLEIFDFELIYGSLNTASLETANNLILTESMAKKLFGRADVVDEPVRIDNKYEALVSAVVADPPRNTQFQFEYFASMEDWTSTRSWTNSWGNGTVKIFAKTIPNTDLEMLNTKIKGVVKANDENAIREPFLKPFGDTYLYNKYEGGKVVGGRIEYVRLFAIVALLVIFIACINYVNLSMAESFRRAKEVGIRKVIGASRGRLLRQFLLESSLTVLAGAILSIIAIVLFIPYFNELTGKAIGLTDLGIELIISFGALIVFTALIAGIYPSLVLMSFKTLSALKGKVDRKGSGFGRLVSKGLVVFQFVIAGILIFAMLIVNRQLEFVFDNQQNLDRTDVVVMNNHNDMVQRHYEQYRSELLTDPSIEHVVAIGQHPINITNDTNGSDWEGKNTLDDDVTFKVFFSSPDFVPAMDLSLVDGRNFSREVIGDTTNFILNEAAIRAMGIENPIGKNFQVFGISGKIIGVVKDFHLNSMHEAIDPLVLANRTNFTNNIMVKTAAGQTKRALEVMEQVYLEIMPGQVFDYDFLEDSYSNLYRSELVINDLSRNFGIITILISCLGLFGITSINAERGVKEIGIRKVLGATLSQTLIRFSGRALIMPLIASLITTPIAYLVMQQWLETFAYHIKIEVWHLAVVTVSTLLISWLTVSLIALRAAKSNPVEALRLE